jgi:hypothetical protein
MTLNTPKCYKCSDYGYDLNTGTPHGIVPSGPNEVINDKGPLTLVAGVPYTVLFKQISVINSTKWTFAGLPACYNSANESVGYEITAKTGTGFTVTAMENSTFEFMAVKI